MKKLLIVLFTLTVFVGCNTKDVAPKPKAEFTFSINEYGAVLLKDVSTNATSIQWDFGDGEISSQGYIEHPYKSNKAFQVSLTAKGEGGSDVIVKTIPVTGVRGSVVIYKAFGTGSSNIAVSIDGVARGTINGSKWYSTSPEFGNQYSVSTDGLKEGSHTFSANEVSGPNYYYWSGTFIVYANNVSKKGLIL